MLGSVSRSSSCPQLKMYTLPDSETSSFPAELISAQNTDARPMPVECIDSEPKLPLSDLFGGGVPHIGEKISSYLSAKDYKSLVAVNKNINNRLRSLQTIIDELKNNFDINMIRPYERALLPSIFQKISGGKELVLALKSATVRSSPREGEGSIEIRVGYNSNDGKGNSNPIYKTIDGWRTNSNVQDGIIAYDPSMHNSDCFNDPRRLNANLPSTVAMMCINGALTPTILEHILVSASQNYENSKTPEKNLLPFLARKFVDYCLKNQLYLVSRKEIEAIIAKPELKTLLDTGKILQEIFSPRP